MRSDARTPGRKALGRATLGYCGLRTARIKAFESVVASCIAQRSHWLDQSQTIGSRLIPGALSPTQRRRQRLFAWLAALRLQFYPMTWIAYTVGALAASAGKPMSMTPYVLGYLTLFLLEVATVFLNDWFDFDSDRRDRNAGPFTGGSHVLVDGCPNREADEAAAKRTLVVILGKRGAVRLAMAATLAAPTITALLSLAREDMAALLGWRAAGGAVHAVWLLRRLRRFTAGEMPEQIDGAIVLALTYILWFCVPPLIALTRASGS